VSPARVAKFLTALAGAGAQALALGLVTGPAQSWVSVGIGILTAVAVFLVPNQEGVPDGVS
jgi:uncharacterized membrane protein YphA (DoxX/SURF4 family)